MLQFSYERSSLKKTSVEAVFIRKVGFRSPERMRENKSFEEESYGQRSREQTLMDYQEKTRRCV